MEALVITPELEADAKRLAEATGQTPTEAVAGAVRTRLQELPPPNSTLPKKSVDELIALFQAHQLTPLNDLSEDEILGYDEFGIPEQPYLGR